MLRSHYIEAAPVGCPPPSGQTTSGKNNLSLKMSKMTIVQLGMVLFAICLSTQVDSQETNSTFTNSTYNHTATTPGILSSPTHSSMGAAVSLNAGGLTVLTPVIMAAFLLKPYC